MLKSDELRPIQSTIKFPDKIIYKCNNIFESPTTSTMLVLSKQVGDWEAIAMFQSLWELSGSEKRSFIASLYVRPWEKDFFWISLLLSNVEIFISLSLISFNGKQGVAQECIYCVDVVLVRWIKLPGELFFSMLGKMFCCADIDKIA